MTRDQLGIAILFTWIGYIIGYVVSWLRSKPVIDRLLRELANLKWEFRDQLKNKN